MPYLFAILLLTAPLYVWRFSIGGLPTNSLMLANFTVIGVGVLMIARSGLRTGLQKIQNDIVELGKPFLIGIGLVGLASIISLFAFGVNAEKIAQWVVLYAQPILLFVLMRYFASNNDERVLRYFKIAAYTIVGAAGALAIVQYFTLFTLPQEWWGNANEPKRAISFFAHANAFGLFVTPLLAWLIPDVVEKYRASSDTKRYWFVAAQLLGGTGIFLSLSRGAWLGLAIATGVYVLLSANKKMIIGFAITGLLLAGVVAATPNLRYRVVLPFMGEKSAVARVSLWNTGWQQISDSPIFGKGVNGFSDNWEKYNTDPNLGHYNFPHNIFLNFWVDLGLLGLLGMIIIFASTIWQGIKNRRDTLALGALLFVVAMVFHGLIDIPYLKNDLALVFWLMLGISIYRK